MLRRWWTRWSCERLQFTTRDLFWCTLLVSLLLANNLSRAPVLRRTGRELDVAIRGRGFLPLVHRGIGEPAYTRCSHLAINNCGQLCLDTPAGDWVVDPVVTIPPDYQRIEISEDGIVMMQQPGNHISTMGGQIQLAHFINPAGLAVVGEELMAVTDRSGPPMITSAGSGELGYFVQHYELTDGTQFHLRSYSWETLAVAIVLTLLAWEVRFLKRRLDSLAPQSTTDACSK